VLLLALLGLNSRPVSLLVVESDPVGSLNPYLNLSTCLSYLSFFHERKRERERERKTDRESEYALSTRGT
jgi:hypothetical protein